MVQTPRPAPPLDVGHWFNTPDPITLDRLRGKVVAIEAFQMLCPGCVSHGLPQAGRIRETFGASGEVVVLGLHTVFEHHSAQAAPEALEAFLHEYRITFPVGIDRQRPEGGLPATMNAYNMQGTPTLILIDRDGRRRAQHFGHVPDLRLGAEIMALLAESSAPEPPADRDHAADAACDETGCPIP